MYVCVHVEHCTATFTILSFQIKHSKLHATKMETKLFVWECLLCRLLYLESYINFNPKLKSLILHTNQHTFLLMLVTRI